MSNGGYKGASPARETSPEQYPGVWELTEQFQAQADGNWPFQADDCAPKSLRFNGSSAYLGKTLGTKTTTFTLSFWVKRSKLGTWQYPWSQYDGSGYSGIGFSDDNRISLYNGGHSYTTAYFRDTSAWYHLCLKVSSGSGTLYVNNQEVATQTGLFLGGGLSKIGDFYSGSHPFDGYIAEFNAVADQALDPDAFTFIDGQGILQPKRFTGDYSSGPVYSNFLTGGIDPNYPAPNGFDGVTSGVGVRTSANGTMVWQPSSPIGFNSSFKIYCALDGNSYGNTFTVTHAGGTTDFTSSVVTTTTNTAVDLAQISGVTSPITNITVVSGGSNPRFSAIEVDGTFLIDAAVGRNSFHLEFEASADRLAKDTSGLGNHWAANNVHIPATETATYYTTTTLYHTLADVLANGTNRGQSAFTLSASEYVYIVTGKGGADGQLAHGSGTTWPLGYVYANLSPASGYEWTYTGGYGSSEAALQYWHNEGTAANGAENAYTYAADIPMYLFSDTRNNVSGAGYQPTANSSFASGTSFPALINTTNNNPITGDISVDSPVNGNEASTGAAGERRGNYATLSPLLNTVATLSNGNLLYTASAHTQHCVGSTIAVSSGKYYWEYTIETAGTYHYAGIADIHTPFTTNWCGSNSGWSIGINGAGNISWNNAENHGGIGISASSGQTWGWALDMDAGTLHVYVDGVIRFSGNSIVPSATSLKGRSITPAAGHSANKSLTFNFGQRPFKYQNAGTNRPNADYKPLATSFLPEPSEVAKVPSKAFDTLLWDGQGVAADRTVSGLDMASGPDMVWSKTVNHNYHNNIYDVVRGFSGGGAALTTDYTASQANAGQIKSTNSTSITWEKDSSNGYVWYNESGKSYLSWCWDAGETTTTIAAGGLNTSAYNQDSTWSTGSGISTASSAFDGDLSTGGAVSSSGTAVTVTTASFTGRRIRFYKNGNNDQLTTITVNGTAYTFPLQSTATGWVEVDLGSSINVTSFTTTWYGNYTLHAVEVDGKILVDSTATPANVPTIATTVRARPDAGFSIAKYQGDGSTSGPSIAHNLGTKPAFVIIKNLDGSQSYPDYYVKHKDIGDNYNIRLNLYTGRELATGSGSWYQGGIGNLDDANVISFLTGSQTSTDNVNKNGVNYIAYCWAERENYSKMSSYVGSGNQQLVYLGFMPAWLMIKRYTDNTVGEWTIYDTARAPFNEVQKKLWANNASTQEDHPNNSIDIVSNGFVVDPGSDAPNVQYTNNGNVGYLYVAFAQNPFASNNRAR